MVLHGLSSGMGYSLSIGKCFKRDAYCIVHSHCGAHPAKMSSFTCCVEILLAVLVERCMLGMCICDDLCCM